MKTTPRIVSCLAVLAAALLITNSAPRASAQAESSQKPLVPTTTWNPATSKLNRTKAGPITRPMIVEIAYKTYLINEYGLDSQYLLVGTKRALLIDTGSGFYDIKATIAKLTNLPYDVAITHGHPDHAGGMREFPAVWIGAADIKMAKSWTQEGAKRYGEILWHMPIGYKDVWGYTPADTKWGDWNQMPKFEALYEGKTFDLGGGRVVTAYHTPGHTPGSYVFLDPRTRILFTGDAANSNELAATLPLVTELRSLLKIKSLAPEYDRIYDGHTAYAGTIDTFPQDPRVLDDLITNCREILSGKITGKTEPNFLFPSKTEFVSRLGSAQIVYNPNDLWVPGEPHIIP